MLNLDNLKTDKLFLYMFLFLSLIFPGLSYLYLFDYSTLIKIEFWQFIFICLFYSIPLFIYAIFMNLLSNEQYIENSKTKENEKLENLLFDTSWQLILISILGLIFYFGDNYFENNNLTYIFFYYYIGIGYYIYLFLKKNILIFIKWFKKNLKRETFFMIILFILIILTFILNSFESSIYLYLSTYITLIIIYFIIYYYKSN